MGDIADVILDGSCCQWCLCVIDGEAPGHPRSCDECQAEEADPDQA